MTSRQAKAAHTRASMRESDRAWHAVQATCRRRFFDLAGTSAGSMVAHRVAPRDPVVAMILGAIGGAIGGAIAGSMLGIRGGLP